MQIAPPFPAAPPWSCAHRPSQLRASIVRAPTALAIVRSSRCQTPPSPFTPVSFFPPPLSFPPTTPASFLQVSTDHKEPAISPEGPLRLFKFVVIFFSSDRQLVFHPHGFSRVLFVLAPVRHGPLILARFRIPQFAPFSRALPANPPATRLPLHLSGLPVR